MTEEFEEPERPRRRIAGSIVIDDDRPLGGDAARANRCSIIARNDFSGAGSVSFRLSPNRSKWIAPGMCPAANCSAGRTSSSSGRFGLVASRMAGVRACSSPAVISS